MNPYKQTQPLPGLDSLFLKSQPLELEIGSARGHYLLARAKSAPDRNILGIEIKKALSEKTSNRVLREEVPNARIVHGNAWDLVPDIPDEHLVNITLNFPDPWWKKKHFKRKVLNESFQDILSKKLAPKATFFVQTDVFSLFEEYFALLNNDPSLENKSTATPLMTKNPMDAQSHREKKCLELEIPIYRMLFVKKSS